MLCGRSPRRSCPSMRTVPAVTRGVARPMMERTSDVLPMPLRPSTATISPGATRIDTPDSTAAWPYEAPRPSISSMAGTTQVDLLHLGIAADLVRAAFHQHGALRHADDAVDQAQRQVDVVFDQHQRQ